MMFSYLFLDLAEAVSGHPRAVLFHRATGFSTETFRKNAGLPRRANAKVRAQKKIGDSLRKQLRASGVTVEDAGRLIAGQPEGVLQLHLYWMVYQDCPHHESSRATAIRYDLIDERLSALVAAGDIDGLSAALTDRDLIGDELRRPLLVSGLPDWPDDHRQGEDPAVRARLQHLYANMLLSFLAILDHEVRPDVTGHSWVGQSLVALLIAPVTPVTKRMVLQSPVAFLVDLVGAIGIASVQSKWPASRPTASVIGNHMRKRGLGGSYPARYVNSLRSGHAKLDVKAFRRLFLDVKPRSAGPNQTIETEARMLNPLLIAAHLLTLMMPRVPGAPRHHDRRGWREAYLGWWQFHAAVRGSGRPSNPGVGPPKWLTFD